MNQSDSDLDALDADVPMMAVQGLNEASKRARKSGRPIVLVRGGQLLRISAEGTIVLKDLPPRRKSLVRRKTITS